MICNQWHTRSVPCWKYWSQNISTVTKSRSKWITWWMMGHNLGPSSVGAWRKYVRELALEHTQPMHFDEMSWGTGRLVVLNPRRLQSQASSSSSSMNATLTIGQRRWKDIPAVQEVDNCCCFLLKIVKNFLTSSWWTPRSWQGNRMEKLLSQFNGADSFGDLRNSRTQDWIDQLRRGSHKARFLYFSGHCGKLIAHVSSSRPLWRKQSWSTRQRANSLWMGRTNWITSVRHLSASQFSKQVWLLEEKGEIKVDKHALFSRGPCGRTKRRSTKCWQGTTRGAVSHEVKGAPWRTFQSSDW